jgi:hypothetical protein
MTTRRTFSAAEIARLLKSHVDDDETFELGPELKAIKMAAHSGDVFQIERLGQVPHFLRDAAATELAEISAALWDKLGPDFIGGQDVDELTPDNLKDVLDTGDPLVPDALRDKPEPDNLAPDPLGLTPDCLRDIITDPGLAKRLATGTATEAERFEDLLTPDGLRGQGE